MNREILFRGKSLLTGEWIESGSLRQWDNGCVGLVHPARRTEKVDPSTVGQYTGLKDRNGKRIFEGDIVRCRSRIDNADMVVIFEKGEFRLVLCEDYKEYETDGGFYRISCFEKEIIGNIHDNTELVEV